MTDRSEFLEAARSQAFTVDSSESADFGRQLIHCRGRFTGADWDLDAVLAEIESAADVAWSESFSGHDLAVTTPKGQPWRFQVSKPSMTE